MDKRLEVYFDKDLRDVSADPVGLSEYVAELRVKLDDAQTPLEQVKTLGELGVRSRTLGQLSEAEKYLLKALNIIERESLLEKYRIPNQIRLAHVYQWQKRFKLSDRLFLEIIEACRQNQELGYLDFALQHAGKNLYDQRKLNEALSHFKEKLWS